MNEASLQSTPVAQPLSFDLDGQALFGWYHPPAQHGYMTRACAVVMCNPIGYDLICTHRHYRVLAQRLADAGFAVLRYDHHGTGDSAGSDEDPDRLKTWLRSVTRATEYARHLSGASALALFGVRTGGTLALAAASASPIADSLIAWSPFSSGSLYLREMRALRMMREGDAAPAHDDGDASALGGEESAGYLLTAATIAELGALKLTATTQAPAANVLLLARDDIPESDRLARHLISLGCAVTQQQVPGYAAMMRDTFDSVVPLAALAEIVSWLTAQHPLREAVANTNTVPTQNLVRSYIAAPGLRETPVFFGAREQLFGIVSQPDGSSNDHRTGVIFVSVGSNLHIGPNRMYVTQARALAARGCVTLRMDIGGVGESPPHPGRQENHLYALHSVEDVRAAALLLREQHGVERVVAFGVCSGAYLSFHAALADAGISGVVLVNPQTFTWREGDSLELRAKHSIRSMNFYRSRLFTTDTWRRVSRGDIDLRTIIQGVLTLWRRRIARRSSEWGLRGAVASDIAVQLNVRRAFKSLLRRGADVHLIYSAEDGGINEMEIHLGPDARSLSKRRHFSLDIARGADHTFTPRDAQRRLQALLTSMVSGSGAIRSG